MSEILLSPRREPSFRAVAVSALAIAAGSIALGAGGRGGVGALKTGGPSWFSMAASGSRALLQRGASLVHLPRGPFSVNAPPLGGAEPFLLKTTNALERERATRCLANAVYYEAATEPEAGQRAVAQVVLNRVRDPNFPKSICGVVYQGWERQTGCQFSFTCDGSLLRGAPNAALMANARRVAAEALAGQVAAEVGTATHYHADYVSPWWKASVTRVAQIGAHIFYRWPGVAGSLAAFTGRYQGGETRLSEAVLTGRAPRPILPAAEPDPTVLALERIVVADATAPEGVRHRIRATLSFGQPDMSYSRPPPTPEQVAQINAAVAAAHLPPPALPAPPVESAAPAAKPEPEPAPKPAQAVAPSSSAGTAVASADPAAADR